MQNLKKKADKNSLNVNQSIFQFCFISLLVLRTNFTTDVIGRHCLSANNTMPSCVKPIRIGESKFSGELLPYSRVSTFNIKISQKSS